MSLGTLTKLEGGESPNGPLWFERFTLVGDNAYAAGGSVGLLAALRALKKSNNLNILAVIGQDNAGKQLGYDHVNDKLKVYAAGGAEETNGDKSGTTYNLVIVSA